MSSVPKHLQLYNNPAYFEGGRSCSGYDDYANCRGVLENYSTMLAAFRPTSVLDVGAAYGFVVDYFHRLGVPAFGVEPSAVALSHVAPSLKPFIYEGALPELPKVFAGTVPSAKAQPDPNFGGAIYRRFDLVTCTEVLEHVPEVLVPASLEALADRTSNYLVLLIMLEGPGADGDEGHICLKSRAWWNEQLDATGLEVDGLAEHQLNNHPYSVNMYWSTRFFVRRRPQVKL
jgi:SAM-dependent methyltransferase